MESSLITITLIIAITLLLCLWQYFQFKERKAMIEKGLDPALVDVATQKKTGKSFLYAGIMLLGIALGILSGILIAGWLNIPGETKECILLSVIVFTGLSSFICYLLSRNKHA